MHWSTACREALDEIYERADTYTTPLDSIYLDSTINVLLRTQTDGDWLQLGARTVNYGRCHDFDVGRDLIHEMLLMKQRDYGSRNIERCGGYGIVVRASDKVARIMNLEHKGTYCNESLEDSVRDLIGYAALGMMWERGTFLLPFHP